MAAAASPAASLAVAAKTAKTAVALVPPRALWPAIQEQRCFADKSYVRWPPHVNLLYPFLEEQHFEVAAAAASEALRQCRPLSVTLAEPGWFEHGRSCTLWLRPDAEELLAVQAALARAFPQCTDLSGDAARGISAFTPHLSLGQYSTPAAVAAAAAELGERWQPLTFAAGGVALLARDGFEDPFSLRWWVPLGGGPPVRVDAPYLATAGPPASMPTSSGSALGAELMGLGAARADGTVWNFAYGANMSPAKLGGARGLHPLESVPARLPGWRLAFTHRGGMGDVQPLAAGEAGEGRPGGDGAVHGVLHRLSASQYGALARMEHEYLPLEVEALPYSGRPPVPAVVFSTPADRRIAEGLPPPRRYLSLLQEGAQHWQLEPSYAAWLCGMRGVEQRSDAYYTQASTGLPLEALPKIRTGSKPQGGHGRGGRRGGGGRGGGERRAAQA